MWKKKRKHRTMNLEGSVERGSEGGKEEEREKKKKREGRRGRRKKE